MGTVIGILASILFACLIIWALSFLFHTGGVIIIVVIILLLAAIMYFCMRT